MPFTRKFKHPFQYEHSVFSYENYVSKNLKNRPLTPHTGVLSKRHENESDASEMSVESLKMTQVKQIQSISNTNRMVKVLLEAHEVCTDGKKKN